MEKVELEWWCLELSVVALDWFICIEFSWCLRSDNTKCHTCLWCPTLMPECHWSPNISWSFRGWQRCRRQLSRQVWYSMDRRHTHWWLIFQIQWWLASCSGICYISVLFVSDCIGSWSTPKRVYYRLPFLYQFPLAISCKGRIKLAPVYGSAQSRLVGYAIAWWLKWKI